MNRLDEQYQEQDSLEERRIIFAIIMAGIIMALIMSLVANIALMVELSKRPLL